MTEEPSALSELERIMSEGRFDRNVLEALLVLSSKDGDYETVTVDKRIFGEIVGGVLKYVGADEDVSDSNGFESGGYEEYLWATYKKHEDKLGKLEPRLKSAFDHMFKFHYDFDCTGEGGASIWLYAVIPQFVKLSMESRISLPYKFVTDTMNRLDSVFSKEELEQLKGIAKGVAPLSKKAIEYVKTHYLW